MKLGSCPAHIENPSYIGGTDFKRGAIVEPISDCKTKGKRGVVIDCDTRHNKSLVHIFSMRQQAWYIWQNLRLLQPSTSYVSSCIKALRDQQNFEAAGLVKSS
jgi:hypothetical protein